MLKRRGYIEIAPYLSGVLDLVSLATGIVAFIDLIFRPLQTEPVRSFLAHFGVSLDGSNQFLVNWSPIALFTAFLIVRYLANRDDYSREGIAQLADACCVHTVRLVTLLQELRKKPERASNALDSDGLYGIPLESALFRFRIANIILLQDEATWNPLKGDDANGGGCVAKSTDKLVTSDVEYDFKFKLAWRTKFFDKLPLVSWIFGDNGKRPEGFRYYYSYRSTENDRIAAPEPYKKSSFSYTPNEGLYVVSHDVCPAAAGPDRIFGMHYYKRGCLDWDFDDDFTIYPTAIAGNVHKAIFRVELQKEISDVLDSYGGVKLELHEFVCSGAKPGNGHQPAHFIRKGNATAGSQLEERGGSAVASAESLFCNGREYVIFETPEIKIDPNNVYILLVKSDKEALDVLRREYDSENIACAERKSKLKRVFNCVFAKE